MDKELRLTSFSSSGGWAGKASIEVLDRVLGQINNIKSSEKILIDHKFKDDAAVYKFSDNKALIFTTDFFSPIVDDPYVFGQIASVNAISDIYAMGGKPFLALNISCFSFTEICKNAIEICKEIDYVDAVLAQNHKDYQIIAKSINTNHHPFYSGYFDDKNTKLLASENKYTHDCHIVLMTKNPWVFLGYNCDASFRSEV